MLPCAHAQNGVGNTTSTPVPGVPHDYIVGVNEIVNPANGALSIRIKQPAPPERGYNWPKYAFMYDSNLTYTLIPTWQQEQIGNENTEVLTNIQYSYNPLAFIVPISSLYTTVSACIQNNQSSCVTYQCTYSYGYVFTDPDGGRHPLGLSVGVPDTHNTSNDCNEFSAQWGGNYTEGGDENYKATWSGGLVDLHGNHPATEDTNGNLLNSTGRTTPRPVPDTTTNGTAAFSRVYNATAQSSGTGCNFGTQITPTPPSPGGPQSVPVVASVTLPNNEKYTFLYDQTYGLLTRIIYPTGAYVTYIWSPVINAEGVQWQAPPAIGTETGSGGTCAFRHDWFAITSRFVNDGTQNTQEQDFYYSTQWPTGTAGYQWLSKTTVVTTKDLLKNTSFQTRYQYSPAQSPRESYANWEDLGYVPVENSITYNDTNGNLLKKVTKVWGTPDLMIAECETLPGGQTSGKFYTYAAYTPFQNGSVLNGAAGASNLPTDVAEFDYGTVSSSCTKPSSLPMRETVTNYQAFGNTPLFAGLPSIEDRPSSVQVYGSVNGVRTLLQETDYAYDGQLLPTAVTPTPVGHDETNYGATSTAPRGNPTTVTEKCFVGSTNCTNPVSVTTYTYDTTGQVLSVTDANHNTTNYSYADSYTSDDGTQPGNTNAYVTKITEPVTNGVAHISTFQCPASVGNGESVRPLR
jgi:YD repeat-containing protein